MSDHVTSITVRMYNTGSVGDCILLLFKKANTISFRMLIDCGGFNTSATLLTPCVEDIKTVCSGELDLLVVTHQHEDHISGFNLARKVFDKITVKETWMSWVENKADPVAIILKEKFGKKLKELKRMAASGIKILEQQSQLKTDVVHFGRNLSMKKTNMAQTMELLEFEAGLSHGNHLAPGSKTNEDAMNYVKGKGKTPIYRRPGEVIKNIQGAEGIKFYILGPPDDADLKFLKIEMQEDEMYHLAAGRVGNEAEEPVERIFQTGTILRENVSPFNPEFFCTAAEKSSFSKTYNSDDFKWRQIEADWIESGSVLALALTRLTNNTSLAMALEFEGSGEVVLLPADAQTGNWISWQKPAVMSALKTKGGKDTNELLANTVFYKVGHHGSHNGTASTHGLEKMPNSDKLVAFMPLVQNKVPKQWGGAKNFPAKVLNKKLIEKTRGRMVRTDEGLVTDPAAKTFRTALSIPEGKELEKNLITGKCFYEYIINQSS